MQKRPGILKLKKFGTIKTDRQKHAEMLKGLVVADIKNNKF
jgi:hypothetical protein